MQLAGEQTTLNEGWRAEEARLGKPLVIFLDQVEEVFTRPDPAQPRELDEFLAVLATALGNRELGLGASWCLGSARSGWRSSTGGWPRRSCPGRKVFLKQLDRRGIIEAIRGPARPGRLQRQYRLIDRGRLARDHRRQPAGRRRLGPGPDAPGPSDQDVGASPARPTRTSLDSIALSTSR